MDANQFQQFLQAIQALQPAAPVAPPAATRSPYDGDAINFNTRSGATLYSEAIKALSTSFDGIPEKFYPFLAELQSRAETCQWDGANHGILSVNNNDLLTNYGRITSAQVETARVASEAGNELRDKQNASMMYECLWNSIATDYRATLASQTFQHNNDGPKLFHHLATQTQEATFAQAIATRSQLGSLHPKRFSYDIVKVNDFISRGVQIMRAAASNPDSVTNQEVLYFLFNCYQRIKTPAEWVQAVNFWKNQTASGALTTPDSVMDKSQALYHQLQTAKTWKPSDIAPEEQIIAMFAKTGTQSGKGKGTKGKDNSTGKKDGKKSDDSKSTSTVLPFADKPGKEGDTKKWNGKTYYYCSGHHKNGHWVLHKPSECRSKKNGSTPKSDSKSSLTVDRNNLKQAMAAIFSNAGVEFDPDSALNSALDAAQRD